MSGPRFAYSPGSWVAVIGQRVWALAELEIGDELVQEVWTAAATGTDEVLDTLLRRGVRALPGFALVELTEDGFRYAVRQPARLRARRADNDSEHEGTASDTWSSGTIEPGLDEIELMAGAAGTLRLPTALGVIPAATLVIDLTPAEGPVLENNPDARASTDAPTASAPEGDASAGLEPSAQAYPPAPEREAPPEPGEFDPADEGAPSNGHVETYYQLLVSSTMDRDELLRQLREDGAAAEDVDAAGADGASAPNGSAQESRSSEATSIWNGDGDEEGLPQASASAYVADRTPGGHSVRPSPSPGGIIDGVPWAAGPSPAAPGTSSPPAQEPPSPPAPAPVRSLPSFTPIQPPPGLASPPPPIPVSAPSLPPAGSTSETPPYPDNPGGDAGVGVDAMSVTISKATLLRQLEEEMQRGPKLLALRCTLNHLSSPYAVTCRVCGSPLPDQEPEEATRPSLGRLVLSNGGTVTLDKGVIFGRAPQSDEADAAKRPNLVRLAESGEISRMHASVTLDDWHVVLRDLGSQNGTFLTMPGRKTEQIRPHQDYTLESGAVISFAEVVTCTFEVSE